jgi:toxin ParE1/3/4
MSFRLSQEAEADLDAIWLYIARASGNIDVANRLIDTITERFWLLGQRPHLGRSRGHDLRPGLRSSAVGEYVIVYRVEADEAVILHVMHGRRDLEGLLID